MSSGKAPGGPQCPATTLPLSGASPSGDKVWPGPHQAQVGTSSRPVGRPHGPGASGTRRNRFRNTSNRLFCTKNLTIRISLFLRKT